MALACVLAASGSAVALVFAVPVETPAVLASPQPASSVRVTHRTDADERQLQLALETGAPRALTTARQGVVTALRCTAGGVVRSGDVVATVDGAPVVAFATATPLWRDIGPDDHGDDVRALQTELARLGVPIAVDGVAGPRTIAAGRTFLTQHGVSAAELDGRSDRGGDRGEATDGGADSAADADSAAVDTGSAAEADTAVSGSATGTGPTDQTARAGGHRSPASRIPVAAFSWIAAPETTERSCSAVVGAAVPADGVLASLPSELRGARLEQVPTDATAGARTVSAGSTTVPIGGDGVIGDAESLAALSALPEYQATVASADDGVPGLSVSWALRDPVEVDVVPPTALWALEGDHACVQPTRGPARRVAVVGSELGQAFVTTSGGAPLDRVRTAPDTGRSCR